MSGPHIDDAAVASALKLTQAEILSFIAAFWRDPNCLRCGRNSWTLGADGLRNLILPVARDNLQDFGGMVVLVWVICANCGHAEFIDSPTLAAWKDGRKRVLGGSALHLVVDNTPVKVEPTTSGET